MAEDVGAKAYFCKRNSGAAGRPNFAVSWRFTKFYYWPTYTTVDWNLLEPLARFLARSSIAKNAPWHRGLETAAASAFCGSVRGALCSLLCAALCERLRAL